MDLKPYLAQFEAMEQRVVQSERALQIISWDWRAMTPRAASPGRAGAIGAVSQLNYDALTDPTGRTALAHLLEHQEGLAPDLVARIKELKKQSDHKAAIPPALFAEFTLYQAQSESAWEQAKRQNDWPSFEPHLQRMFDYTNQFIDLWGWEGSRYNALLGFNEEGMTTGQLDALFDTLKQGLVPLIAQVRGANVSIDDSFLFKNYPVEGQRALATELLQLMGFRLDHGLLAESEHPYTTSFGAQDVRLTTHYYPDALMPAIFSTLHEGGHGLYEQNVGPQLEGTAVGRGLYSGMHESVSRFWENMVGRSAPFWEMALPLLQKHFPTQLAGVTPQAMYRAVNKTGISLTRIEADELTYNLHILLRYELERDVFDGKIQVCELPQLWRQKMEQYLGISPKNDSEGILQDIQWSMAQFGYFPSYALGNLYNAQYTAAMRQQLDFDGCIARGELGKILDWKREHLYRYGCLRTPEQTMVALTGKPLEAHDLVRHLQQKFGALYGVPQEGNQ